MSFPIVSNPFFLFTPLYLEIGTLAMHGLLSLHAARDMQALSNDLDLKGGIRMNNQKQFPGSH